MNEIGNIAFECERGRVHVNEEWVHIEILDADGSPLPPKTEGRFVITSFFNRAMPLIRYDSGDLGTISYDPCPCGRTLNTIQIKGRDMHLLKLKDGRTVSVLSLTGTIDSFPHSIRQYQIVWDGAYSFVIRIIPGPKFKTFKEEVEERLVRIIHPEAHILWEFTDTIPDGPGGKAVYFIDRSKDTVSQKH